MQTCMDLMEAGYSVHICVDAVSSRSPVDRKVALYRMQQSGIHLTTSESVAFQMIQESSLFQDDFWFGQSEVSPLIA